MDMIQYRNRQDATGGRPGQIRSVERAGVLRKARERDAVHHSTEHERNRNEGKSESRPGQFVFRIRRNVQLHCKANGTRQRERQTRTRKCDIRITLLKELDESGSSRKPEHGEGDRHEREVIPHRDAEDPRQKQLELQQREGGKEKAGIRGAFRLHAFRRLCRKTHPSLTPCRRALSGRRAALPLYKGEKQSRSLETFVPLVKGD